MARRAKAGRTKEENGVLMVRPEDLLNHPVSQRVYRDSGAADEEFVGSLDEHGVLVPLVAVRQADGRLQLLSGHRRRQAAMRLRLAHVPVVVVEPADELHAVELVLEHNRYRDKTVEQRAREFEERRAIESERAKSRQGRGGEGTGTTAADEAAESVGWSAPTAKKAAEVVHVIDAAEEAGDSERAEELREKLNEGSVSAAHRAAVPPKPGPPPREKPAPALSVPEVPDWAKPKTSGNMVKAQKAFGQLVASLPQELLKRLNKHLSAIDKAIREQV